MYRPGIRRAASAAALAASLLALTAAAPPGKLAAGAAPGPAGGNVSGAVPLTLITGERVLTGPGGTHTVAPGSVTAFQMVIFSCNQQSEAPLDALPYLGHGLDPGLFDLSALQHAERNGRLPVRLSYRGGLPSVPGITVTRSGNGLADGYLTAVSARRFGAALGRQFLADHARGSYGADGLFAHGLSITLPGHRAAPRTPEHFPMHTLTVTGTDLAGKPDNGDFVLVINADNCERFFGDGQATPFGIGEFFHGVAKFSVPAGHYWAIGEFFASSASQFAVRLPVLPQITVDRDTSAHVAERSASSKIAFKTPRPAKTLIQSITLARSSRESSFFFGMLAIGDESLWVSPVRHAPTFGTFQAYTGGELVSRPGTGTPYAYNLDFVPPPGTIPSQHYVVHPSALATVHENYFQDVPANGAWAALGGTPAQIAHGLFEIEGLPLGTVRHMPSRQVLYLSAPRGVLWATQTFASTLFSGGQRGPFQAYHGGQQATAEWNRYPLHPGVNMSLPGTGMFPVLPSASRAGNTLTLDITPFSDNAPGHLGAGFSDPGGDTHPTGSYALYQNGHKIAGGDAARAAHGHADLLLHANVSPKPSVIRFVLSAARNSTLFPLSASSSDAWTWKSRPEPGATVPPPWSCGVTPSGQLSTGRHCAVQPMLVPHYRVAGLSLAGATKPGSQHLSLAIAQLEQAPVSPVSHVHVQVSFDGGKVWHAAQVTDSGGGRFGAGFTAPAGARVSLRTSAADAAGDTVTETILSAYQVAA